MKFRLLEKFSNEIPPQIKDEIKQHETLSSFLVNDMQIDLANASCVSYPLDDKGFIQLSNDIRGVLHNLEYKLYTRAIFILLRGESLRRHGEVLCAPYDMENVMRVLAQHPEDIKEAYALYNKNSDLQKKKAARKQSHFDTRRLYVNGLVRTGHTYKEIVPHTIPTDKSGYLLNPSNLTRRLNKYRLNNYSDYLNRVYNQLQESRQLLRDVEKDIDMSEDEDFMNISAVYTDLGCAIRSYNELCTRVREVETNNINDPAELKEDMEVVFSSSAFSPYNVLQKHLSILQKNLSKWQSVDFDW